MIKTCLAKFLVLFFALTIARGADVDLAARATNQLGVDLYRQLAAGDENLCLSPYSIQSALAMTFAGSEGETREEMAKVLNFPGDSDTQIHVSFASLRSALESVTKSTTTIAAESKTRGGPSEPVLIAIANRLFAQTGYDFRDSFAELVKRFYGAPLEPLDFKKNPERQREHINKWVADQTRSRIRDLIPPNGVNETTRLVLANAIYLKAPWASEFSEGATKPQPFHVRGGPPVDVPTMQKMQSLGYAKHDGFTAVAIPYIGGDLQFLVLLPDEADGIHQLEARLTNEVLGQCAKMKAREINLTMPKFKFEPPTIPLGEKLQTLGMNAAFDKPPGSANFDRIVPRKSDDSFAISEVFHKTFISVDEKGTEVAAATAVAMQTTALRSEKPKPVEVKIDRPYLYAIQHAPSSACLFIGRVTDPR